MIVFIHKGDKEALWNITNFTNGVFRNLVHHQQSKYKRKISLQQRKNEMQGSEKRPDDPLFDRNGSLSLSLSHAIEWEK